MQKVQREERRGASILLLSLVFMVILLLLSVTLFRVIPAEMHAATRSHEDNAAHYVARAGLRDAMTWLSFQMEEFETTNAEADLPDYNTGTIASPSYPNIDAYETQAAAKRPFNEGDWRFEVEIEPQQDTKTLANNLGVRFFAIRSTAFHKNRPIRRIDCLLEQNSFALYAFLSKNWDPNSTMIITGENSFQGPVHTDDYWNFDVSALESNGWNDTINENFFSDLVSHSSSDPNGSAGGDGNVYTGGAPYDANGPIAGRYEQIFQAGRDDLRTKNEVELPSSTASAFSQTWPDVNNIPGTAGAHVSRDANGVVDGGILVVGDVEELNLRLDRFGNQKIVVSRRDSNGSYTEQLWKWVSRSPREYYNCDRTVCNKWGPPAGGGGAGGAGGGGLNNVCIGWTIQKRTCERRDKVPNGTRTRTDIDPFDTQIYEVTENEVYLTDNGLPSGSPLTDVNGGFLTSDGTASGAKLKADVGQTLILDRVRDDSSTGWEVTGYEILDGQINGNIYVDGSVGGRIDRYGDSYRDSVPEAGLWGIAKGSVATDANGTLQTDAGGNYIYNNKAIITPLNEGIKLGGDLLQFDQTRFDANKGSVNFESTSGGDSRVRNWAEYAALDPHATGGPELSPNNSHVLGVITRDVWMAGPKQENNNRRRELTNNDGANDVYGVFLAGRTQNISGTDVTDGGFGTWYTLRNDIGDRLGNFNIIGGVIQGTEDHNHNDTGNGGRRTHHWVDAGGNVGYDVNMYYDKAATRQRLFPLEKTFGIIRMFEMSVRNR